MGFAGDDWYPSRLAFGKFKGRLYQEAREDAELEASRNRLAELELDYGIEKSKVDSVRSRLFAAFRPFYQERDRLRLLVQFRKAFIERLLAEGEEAAEATAGDYQREAAEKDTV